MEPRQNKCLQRLVKSDSIYNLMSDCFVNGFFLSIENLN